VNESLANSDCPARLSFERAAATAKLQTWSSKDGEFGWHGTGSIEAIESICWSGFATQRRAGQVFGPGEYFSRGTEHGLHYSECWAGGTAANMLVVAWIMSASHGAEPVMPNTRAADPNATGHIVCRNPVKDEDNNESTGEMYCVPIAAVAFGDIHLEYGVEGKPSFRLNSDDGVGKTTGTVSA